MIKISNLVAQLVRNVGWPCRAVANSYTWRFSCNPDRRSEDCFDSRFDLWHVICVTKRVMINGQLHNELDTAIEPAPRFASDAEIKLAEQLRHQLEERYLGSGAAPSLSRPLDQGHKIK